MQWKSPNAQPIQAWVQHAHQPAPSLWLFSSCPVTFQPTHTLCTLPPAESQAASLFTFTRGYGNLSHVSCRLHPTTTRTSRPGSGVPPLCPEIWPHPSCTNSVECSVGGSCRHCRMVPLWSELAISMFVIVYKFC